MFWRALLAFVALPGVVAFAVPFAWLAWRGSLEIVHRGGGQHARQASLAVGRAWRQAEESGFDATTPDQRGVFQRSLR